MDTRVSDLKKDVLEPIANHIKKKRDSLMELARFKNMGIEGWLKVEALAALGNKVKKVQNKGPDLVFEGPEGDIEIELKAATNFQLIWAKDGALQDGVPCLFLGQGSTREMIEGLKSDERFEIIGYEPFDDGKNEWLIAMIEPVQNPKGKRGSRLE
ncbi:hypothetical protein GTO10_00810 [Candidatus Saccharibacteria bacterium]|nr:hypothetical protein [Candidatus Saccharibacteria bacterium]